MTLAEVYLQDSTCKGNVDRDLLHFCFGTVNSFIGNAILNEMDVHQRSPPEEMVRFHYYAYRRCVSNADLARLLCYNQNCTVGEEELRAVTSYWENVKQILVDPIGAAALDKKIQELSTNGECTCRKPETFQTPSMRMSDRRDSEHFKSNKTTLTISWVVADTMLLGMAVEQVALCILIVICLIVAARYGRKSLTRGILDIANYISNMCTPRV